MLHADLDLARRLERTEGRSCAQYAETRRRLHPDSRSTWIDEGGVYAVFDGVDSPVTQTFGLGVFEAVTSDLLDRIEAFFGSFGVQASHEVSPFAGTATLDLLCSRGYRPIEISNVMVRSIAAPPERTRKAVAVRAIAPEEARMWSEVAARGWSDEHPELRDFLLEVGAILTARPDTVCFLASLDGRAGATGVLQMHEATALFGGAATVPELRRQGLQSALLEERLRHAAATGCDLAMIVAPVGSKSQRNAEREGFRVAYTRTKWAARRA